MFIIRVIYGARKYLHWICEYGRVPQGLHKAPNLVLRKGEARPEEYSRVLGEKLLGNDRSHVAGEGEGNAK